MRNGLNRNACAQAKWKKFENLVINGRADLFDGGLGFTLRSCEAGLAPTSTHVVLHNMTNDGHEHAAR